MINKIFLKHLSDSVVAQYAQLVSYDELVTSCYSGIIQNWVYGPWKGAVRRAIIDLIHEHVKAHKAFPTGKHMVFLNGRLYGAAAHARHVAVFFPSQCPEYVIENGTLCFI